MKVIMTITHPSNDILLDCLILAQLQSLITLQAMLAVTESIAISDGEPVNVEEIHQ